MNTGERGARGDRVDEDEALAVADPLVAQGGVFFLAGGVEDFEHAGLAVYDYLFAVGVFDCGIVSEGLVSSARKVEREGAKRGGAREGTYVSTKCCKHS